MKDNYRTLRIVSALLAIGQFFVLWRNRADLGDLLVPMLPALAQLVLAISAIAALAGIAALCWAFRKGKAA